MGLWLAGMCLITTEAILMGRSVEQLGAGPVGGIVMALIYLGIAVGGISVAAYFCRGVVQRVRNYLSEDG